MEFYSLNGSVSGLSARNAILQGLAADGGLFMPRHIPQLPPEFFTKLPSMELPEIGLAVAKLFLEGEVPQPILKGICDDAFNFPCPLVQLDEQTFVLELFHGPTLAFKDFGARFMSRLVGYFLTNEATETQLGQQTSGQQTPGQQTKATVLVATSGDTGSAVAHGFFRVPGTRVVLLYPNGMVSKLQEQQLTTLGENITALRVEGSFDDCQSLVKAAFVDKEISRRLCLVSANSINFARLLPQSLYYIRAYAELAQRFDRITFSVPSGNFGNLTAGVLAKRMGVPIHSFVAAVNSNDTFVRYLNSGKFEPRRSLATISNAMDVGHPSNFVRLLKLFSNDQQALMREISGFSFSDQETREAMSSVFKRTGYILDPHSAIGYLGTIAYLGAEHGGVSGGQTSAQVVLSTAHPAKFKGTVEETIGQAISLPPALADCQDKTQLAIGIPNDFDAFKNLLLALEDCTS